MRDQSGLGVGTSAEVSQVRWVSNRAAPLPLKTTAHIGAEPLKTSCGHGVEQGRWGCPLAQGAWPQDCLTARLSQLSRLH